MSVVVEDTGGVVDPSDIFDLYQTNGVTKIFRRNGSRVEFVGEVDDDQLPRKLDEVREIRREFAATMETYRYVL